MSTRVINLRDNDGLNGPFIYIGRGSKWGNPFTHLYSDHRLERFGMHVTLVGSREEAIEKYEEWLKNQPDLLAKIPTLRGHILGCYCKPLACHGDILARMADEQQ